MPWRIDHIESTRRNQFVRQRLRRLTFRMYRTPGSAIVQASGGLETVWSQASAKLNRILPSYKEAR